MTAVLIDVCARPHTDYDGRRRAELELLGLKVLGSYPREFLRITLYSSSNFVDWK